MDPLDDLDLPPPPPSHPEPAAPAALSDSSGLELDRPAKAPSPPARPSNPNFKPPSRAVVSASRLQPVPEPKGRITGGRLREGAADVVLNGVGILGDVVEDFRRSDRFFKYKAMVLGVWVLLSVTSFMVACPGGGSSNSFGARLVVAGSASEPIYMVKNDSDHQWDNVEVTVNGHWHATAAQIEPNREWVLSPVLLFDAEGHPAGSDLKVSDIEVKVGDDTVQVYRNGQPVQ